LILKRILRNLLSNAIMHSPAGGALLLSCRKVGNQALVQVWDTGAGIPEGRGSDGAANFVAFIARVRETRSKSSSSGYGLGMNNVLQMCRALGITMQLHAKAGKGSVFSFHLPLATSALVEQLPQVLAQEATDLDEIRAYLAARADLPTA
jgi:signal transduction histidine kinase